MSLAYMLSHVKSLIFIEIVLKICKKFNMKFN